MNTLYQSLVAVEPATLIIVICNLFLQIYVVKKFFLNKVLAVLDKRRAAADEQILQAESARAEALAIKSTYEENMKKAAAEASEILSTAQKNAAKRSEEIISQAQAQAAQLKEKASADIAREKTAPECLVQHTILSDLLDMKKCNCQRLHIFAALATSESFCENTQKIQTSQGKQNAYPYSWGTTFLKEYS